MSSSKRPAGRPNAFHPPPRFHPSSARPSSSSSVARPPTSSTTGRPPPPSSAARPPSSLSAVRPPSSSFTAQRPSSSVARSPSSRRPATFSLSQPLSPAEGPSGDHRTSLFVGNRQTPLAVRTPAPQSSARGSPAITSSRQTPSHIGHIRTPHASTTRPPTQSTTPRAAALGLGLGNVGQTRIAKRRVKRRLIDPIRDITKNDIRRLARRGGIKRISGMIYDDVRVVMSDYLRKIIHDCVAILDLTKRKTITANDVIYALRYRGRTLYGFDPAFDSRHH